MHKMNRTEDLDEKLKKLCISPISEHETNSKQVSCLCNQADEPNKLTIDC
jgi:hypothetical protein